MAASDRDKIARDVVDMVDRLVKAGMPESSAVVAAGQAMAALMIGVER